MIEVNFILGLIIILVVTVIGAHVWSEIADRIGKFIGLKALIERILEKLGLSGGL